MHARPVAKSGANLAHGATKGTRTCCLAQSGPKNRNARASKRGLTYACPPSSAAGDPSRAGLFHQKRALINVSDPYAIFLRRANPNPPYPRGVESVSVESGLPAEQ